MILFKVMSMQTVIYKRENPINEERSYIFRLYRTSGTLRLRYNQ